MPIIIPRATQLQPLEVQRRRIPFDTLVNALSYSPAATAIQTGGDLISNVLRQRRNLQNQLEQRRQFENLSGMSANSLGTGEGSLDPKIAYDLLQLKQKRDLETQKNAEKERFNTIYRNFLDLKADKSKDSTSQIIQLRKQFVDQKANTFDPTELQTLQNSIDNIDNELTQRNIMPFHKTITQPAQNNPVSKKRDTLGIFP